MKNKINETENLKLIDKRFSELTTTELYEVLKSRAEIFVVEQEIIYVDMDNIDYNSLHCFIEKDDRVIAYLRAFYDENDKDKVWIGRVLTLEHGHGYGSFLLEQSLQVIKEKLPCKKIVAHAQKHALTFYQRFGFKVTSEEFLEEGIAHIAIELEF